MSYINGKKILSPTFHYGYEDGAKAEYDKFWDNFQDYGNRKSYVYAFYNYHWNNEIFKPKYNMKPNTIYYMFSASNISGDLVEILDDLGVEFDTSEATSVNHGFSYADFTRLGVISTVSASALTSLFRQSLQLHTIDKLILADTGTQTFSTTFTATSALENITIEGVIGENIDFSSCPLTPESMKNIIEHLKDFSNEDESTHWTKTIKFSQACWDALEAARIENPEEFNNEANDEWLSYVGNGLKWNT